MVKYNIEIEEASIVLLGGFNPSIFHPEWLIRKGIVESWDYEEDNNVTSHDLSQVNLPDSRVLLVYLNRLVLKSALASNYLSLGDLVASMFSILGETPISQVGMNYKANIRLNSEEDWAKFGSELAPTNPWREACGYPCDNSKDNPDREKQLGLWELTMNLPRPDDLNGFLRPKIKVGNEKDRMLIFSVNNHVDLDGKGTEFLIHVLSEQWSQSLDIAKDMLDKLINSQLD